MLYEVHERETWLAEDVSFSERIIRLNMRNRTRAAQQGLKYEHILRYMLMQKIESK